MMREVAGLVSPRLFLASLALRPAGNVTRFYTSYTSYTSRIQCFAILVTVYYYYAARNLRRPVIFLSATSAIVVRQQERSNQMREPCNCYSSTDVLPCC